MCYVKKKWNSEIEKASILQCIPKKMQLIFFILVVTPSRVTTLTHPSPRYALRTCDDEDVKGNSSRFQKTSLGFFHQQQIRIAEEHFIFPVFSGRFHWS